MPRMGLSELRAMLQSEKSDALAGMQADKLSSQRAEALRYYMGDLTKDLPTEQGRSRAISSDVADTIDGMMPQLMDVFVGGDEIVTFNPVGPEDEDAADQESDYVNHVFMQQNPGFLILYSMIKDALLSKVGIVKVWWETKHVVERETYTDQSDAAFGMIAQDPEVTIVEHTMRTVSHTIMVPPPMQTGMPPSGLASPNGPPGPGVPPGGGPPSPGAGLPAGLAQSLGPPWGSPLAGPPQPQQIQVTLHDVVVERSKTHAQAKVAAVPPEEFGVSRQTRSIADCNYAFHRLFITEGELIAQGYDANQVKAIPSYAGTTNTEEINRDTVNEYQYYTDKVNRSARRLEIVEHYIRMDYNGDGEAKLFKVTTGGPQGEIMRKAIEDDDEADDRDEGAGGDSDDAGDAAAGSINDNAPRGADTSIPPRKRRRGMREDIEEFDMMPFACMTPTIMPHRFFGRSMADLVSDVMRIKTALVRGLLDNVYLRNNPRVEVAEQMAGPDTLDDLLVARPGGMVRVKQPGGINWQEVPDVTASVYPALEYMDTVREWRTGVTRQGQGIDAKALQNQSATAVSQTYSMAQARIKLYARVFAETGIKDLFILLHGLIRKHGQEAQTVRLRNQWVQVDPRDWKKRDDLTVHVGLGDGSKSEQIAHINTVIALQAQALLQPGLGLVKPDNLYNSAKQLVKLIGLKDPSLYFTDPSNEPPAPAPPPTPEMIKVQAEQQQMQQKAQLEQQKAAADTQHQIAKTQADIALAERKHALDLEKAHVSAALDAAKSEREHQYKVTELSMKQQADARAHDMVQRQHALDLAKAEGEHAIAKSTAKMTNDNGQLAAMTALHAALTKHTEAVTKLHAANGAGGHHIIRP